MTTTWHAPPDAIARYANAAESLDEITAASLEQHLLACPECRAAVAAAADPAALALSWDAVADAIDRPRPTVGERVLRRIGVPEELARLVTSTTELQLVWLVLVVGLAWAAVATARDRGTDSPFLVLAPVVPLVAVMLMFRPSADPAGEAGASTPLHGAGLAMRRVVAVLVPTLLVVGAAGLALPDLGGAAVAWVLPGLALSASTVAASTYVRAATAATAFAMAWFAALAVVSARPHHHVEVADTVIFAARGQLVAVAVVLAAAAIVYLRRDRFETLEVRW